MDKKNIFLGNKKLYVCPFLSRKKNRITKSYQPTLLLGRKKKLEKGIK